MNATTTETMTDAQKLVQAIRARGVESTDFRHAVHEAFHALDAKVPAGKWDCWSLDRYIKKLGRSGAAGSELKARAVEQILCERFGVQTRPLEHWILISCMEASKFGDAFMPYDDAFKGAELYMKGKQAQKDADAIMALVNEAPTSKKTVKKKTTKKKVKTT